MGPEKRQKPAPIEHLLFRIAFALEQQQFHLVALQGGQVLAGYPQGTQLGFEQPRLAVGIHPIQHADVAVLHQHGRGGYPGQPVHGNPGEHHPQTQGVEDLAQVDQVELTLPLQDSFYLVYQGIAVDGDAEVVGEGAADRDRNIPGAGGPAKGQVVAAALRPGGLGFGGEAVFPFA